MGMITTIYAKPKHVNITYIKSFKWPQLFFYYSNNFSPIVNTIKTVKVYTEYYFIFPSRFVVYSVFKCIHFISKLFFRILGKTGHIKERNTNLLLLHFLIPFSELAFYSATRFIFGSLIPLSFSARIHSLPLIIREHYNFQKCLPNSITLFIFTLFSLTSWVFSPSAFSNCLHNHLIYSFPCLKNMYSLTKLTSHHAQRTRVWIKGYTEYIRFESVVLLFLFSLALSSLFLQYKRLHIF